MPLSRRTDLEGVFASRGWLSEQPAAFRGLVLSTGMPVELQAGAFVFRRGDEAVGLYGILSGAIGIESGHQGQAPLLNHVLRSGEWFGLKAVLGGGARELSYWALEPAQLLLVPRSRLLPLMHADPDVAIRVGQLAELATRLGNWVTRDLQTPDAGRRLAAVLVRVLGAGEVQPEELAGFRLSHRQLSEMANLSRLYVGRKLATFEAAGWIACSYSRIRLLDAKGLAAFAYGDDNT